MAAYWVSVEQKMKLRWKTLLVGANHIEWASEAEMLSLRYEFFGRYLADMRELAVRDGIVPIERMEALASCGWETPADWAEKMHDWPTASLFTLEAGSLGLNLIDTWLRLLPAFGGELQPLSHLDRS